MISLQADWIFVLAHAPPHAAAAPGTAAVPLACLAAQAVPPTSFPITPFKAADLEILEAMICSRPWHEEVACPYCEKQLANRSNLRRHIRSRHSSQRPFVCSYCRQGYADSSNYKKHQNACNKQKWRQMAEPSGVAQLGKSELQVEQTRGNKRHCHARVDPRSSRPANPQPPWGTTSVGRPRLGLASRGARRPQPLLLGTSVPRVTLTVTNLEPYIDAASVIAFPSTRLNPLAFTPHGFQAATRHTPQRDFKIYESAQTPPEGQWNLTPPWSRSQPVASAPTPVLQTTAQYLSLPSPYTDSAHHCCEWLAPGSAHMPFPAAPAQPLSLSPTHKFLSPSSYAQNSTHPLVQLPSGMKPQPATATPFPWPAQTFVAPRRTEAHGPAPLAVPRSGVQHAVCAAPPTHVPSLDGTSILHPRPSPATMTTGGLSWAVRGREPVPTQALAAPQYVEHGDRVAGPRPPGMHAISMARAAASMPTFDDDLSFVLSTVSPSLLLLARDLPPLYIAPPPLYPPLHHPQSASYGPCPDTRPVVPTTLHFAPAAQDPEWQSLSLDGMHLDRLTAAAVLGPGMLGPGETAYGDRDGHAPQW